PAQGSSVVVVAGRGWHEPLHAPSSGGSQASSLPGSPQVDAVAANATPRAFLGFALNVPVSSLQSTATVATSVAFFAGPQRWHATWTTTHFIVDFTFAGLVVQPLAISTSPPWNVTASSVPLVRPPVPSGAPCSRKRRPGQGSGTRFANDVADGTRRMVVTRLISPRSSALRRSEPPMTHR